MIKLKTEIAKKLIYAGMVLCSILAAIKMVMLGLNIDEEYAIAMSYRMAQGDRMFIDMWEPHQTSGFVCALFIRAYVAIFNSNAYLVLFLRSVGVLLQGGVSLFVYTTLKRRYVPDIAFWAALLCFNSLPKWIQVPEFSNILLWCSLCTWMCLLRYAENPHTGVRWLVSGAVFYCGMVLAYPSALLVFPVYLWGLYRVTPSGVRRLLWFFAGGCVVLGLLYLISFLCTMSLEDFVFGLQQMMTDGEHSDNFLKRLAVYGGEILTWIPLLLAAVLPALVAGRIWGKRAFGGVLILISCAQQLYYWLLPGQMMNQPLLFFYLIYGVGVCCRKQDRELFYLGYVPAGASLLAVLILTNTTLGVSGIQLLPGMICASVCLLQGCGESSARRGLRCLIQGSCFMLLAVLLFAKGWLVCVTYGYKTDVLFVKQKALYGSAKNVYCGYLDGYHYNALAELLNGRETEEVVIYVTEKYQGKLE